MIDAKADDRQTMEATTGAELIGTGFEDAALLALERRILLDAAGFVTAQDALDADQNAAAEPTAVAPQTSGGSAAARAAALFADGSSDADAASGQGTPVEIVFVDPTVENAGAILAALPAHAEIVHLDAQGDGVSQIAQHLAGRQDVGAIHIVSHGREGALDLGSATLDADSAVSIHAGELAAIGDALVAGGDILIYGCDFAGGAEGAAAAAALASATGADIAASDDPTGAAERGGDWTLEHSTGAIETASIVAADYDGLLAPLVISVSGSPQTTQDGTVDLGPVANGYVGSASDPVPTYSEALWVNAGSLGTTSIDLRATVLSRSLPDDVAVLFNSSGDDPSVILLTGVAGAGAEVTILWEVFESGTNQTVAAVGTPTVTIGDIDGDGAANTIETVIPSLEGLLLAETSVGSELIVMTANGQLTATGTEQDPGNGGTAARETAAIRFSYADTSGWVITYRAERNEDGRVYRNDGDGDFTFSSPPVTTAIPQIDLDTDDSTTTGTGVVRTHDNLGTAVAVADDVSITNYSGTVEGAVVTLTNAAPGDELAVAGATGTAGTVPGTPIAFSISGGTVTFSGAASVAEYELALASVTFDTSPLTTSVAERVIETYITVPDGSGGAILSNLARTSVGVAEPSTLNLDPSNISGGPDDGAFAATYVEDLSPVGLVASNVSVTGAADSFDTVTIAFAGLADAGDETLLIGTQPFALDTPVAGATVAVSGGPTVTVVLDTAAPGGPALTLSRSGGGALSANDVETLLRALAYQNSSQTPAANDRTVSFDANLTVGATISATTILSVMPSPDAPTLNLDPDNDSGTPADATDDGADDGGFAVTFNENDPSGAPLVDADMTLFDFEDDIVEVVVTLVNGKVGDRILFPSILAGGDITVDIAEPAGGNNNGTLDTDGTMTVTLTGNAAVTATQWTDALKSLGFEPSSFQPDDPDVTQRVITIRAVDTSFLSSETRTTFVDIVATNDAPTLDLDTGNTSGVNAGNVIVRLTEGEGAKPIHENIATQDLDDTQYQSASVTLTNPQAQDQLFIGMQLVYDDGAVVTASGSAGTIAYTVTLTGGVPTIAFSGAADIAAYDAALELVAFSNRSDAPDTTQRVIDVSVSDGQSVSPVRQAFVQVTGVNDAPVPVNDMAVVAENGIATFAPLSNDTDADNPQAALTITEINGVPVTPGVAITLPSGALVSVDAAGQVTYDPNGAFDGLTTGSVAFETLSYTLSDNDPSDPRANTGVISVTIAGQTQGVTARDNTRTLGEDATAPATGNLIGDDDGTGSDAALDGLARQQLVWENAFTDGETVDGRTVTVDDVTLTLSIDTPNGSAIVGDASGPGTGEVETTQPAGLHSGYLSLAIDPTTAAPDGTMSATVGFDQPVENLAFQILEVDRSGTAVQDQVTILAFNGGVPVPVTVLANSAHISQDAGGHVGGTDGAAGANGDANLFVSIDGPADEIRIVYAAGPQATDADPGVHRIGVSDMSWDASGTNDLTLAGVMGATDPGQPVTGRYGTLTWAGDGTYSYSVNTDLAIVQALGAGDALVDTFTYEVRDTLGSPAFATLSVTVEGANDAPVLDNPPGRLPGLTAQDAQTVPAGAQTVAPFFSDAEGDALTFTATGLPDGLSMTADGAVVGTVSGGASTGGPLNDGVYTVQVTATDTQGAATTASFAYTITNPEPQARDDAFVTAEDVAITDNVIANLAGPAAPGSDSDPDGDALALTLVRDAQGGVVPFDTPTMLPGGEGTLTIGTDGTFAFQPAPDFNGPVSFSYVLVDADGATGEATARIDVQAVDDPEIIDLDPNNDSGTPVDPSDDDADDRNFATSYTEGDMPPVRVADLDVAVSGVDGASTSLPLEVRVAGFADAATPGMERITVLGQTFDAGLDATATLDLGGVALTIAYTADPAAGTGTFVLDMAGEVALTTIDTILRSFTYDHTGVAPSEGDRTFDFQIIGDGTNPSNAARSTVTVIAVNSAPALVDPTDPGFPIDRAGADGEAIAPIDVAAMFLDIDDPRDALILTASGLPAGLSLVDGAITGRIDPDASQGGPAGDGVYTVQVAATDPAGATATATFNLTITNPAPVGRDDAAVMGEDDAALAGDVIGDPLTGDTDGGADTDRLRLAGASQDGRPIALGAPTILSGGGVLTLADDGTWLFDPGRAYNGLDEGESVVETIAYTLDDGQGGTDTAALRITVTGANDAPVLVDPADPGAAHDPTPAADPANLVPALAVTDGADHTASPLVDLAPYALDPEGNPLTFSTAAPMPEGLVLNADGTVTGTLSSSASQGGDAGRYTIPVTVSDGTGSDTLTLTITVTNLAPQTRDDAFVTAEDVAITDNVIANLAGPAAPGSDSDPDGDALAVVAASQDGRILALGVPNPLDGGGTLTLSADGEWRFDPGRAYEHLAQGERATETVRYTLADADGATDEATLTITVEGRNTPPIPIDPTRPAIDPSAPPAGVAFDPRAPHLPPLDPQSYIPLQGAGDGEAVQPLDLRPYFGEADLSDTLTLTVAPGALPPGLVLNDGVISGTIDASASQGTNVPGGPAGTYVVPVTASDGLASFTTFLTYEIANLPPVAQPEAATVDPNGPSSFTIATQDGSATGGADRDDDVIRVTRLVTGPDTALLAPLADGEGVGTPVAGSQGGLFTVQTDGSVQFDPGTDFQELPEGVSAVTQVSYRIDDGEGGFDEAVISVTIVGTNDAPHPIAPSATTPGAGDPFAPPADPANYLPVQRPMDGVAAAPLALAPYFGDVDMGDAVVISLDTSALPPGLVFDPTSATITGSPHPSASQGGDPAEPGVYRVEVTATDRLGAQFSTWLIYDVANSEPSAPSMPDMVAWEGTPQTLPMPEGVSDRDGDVLSFFASALPEGLSIDPQTGQIRGMVAFGAALGGPAGDGVHRVTVTVSDGEGGTSTVTFDYTVLRPGAGALAGPAPSEAAPDGPPSHQADLVVEPIVTDTVNGLETLSIATALTADQVVTQAVNGIRSLGGGQALSEAQVIGTMIEGQQAADAAIAQRESEIYRGAQRFVPLSIAGAEIVLRTSVQQDNVYLDLGPLREASLLYWRVQGAAGGPLPEWVKVLDGDLVLIERVGGIENAAVEVAARRADGSSVLLVLRIDMHAGQILLEEARASADENRADASGPAASPFARAVAEAGDVEADARRLFAG